MTSEIRANTLKNRVGLGTVSFTNTGPVVSGVSTFSNKIQVGSGATIESNGQATYTGIVTASSFKLSDGSSVVVYLQIQNLTLLQEPTLVEV